MYHKTRPDAMNALIKSTVSETLTALGFDLSDGPALRQDLLYLRKARTAKEDCMRTIKNSLIAVVIPACCYLMWEGLHWALHYVRT